MDGLHGTMLGRLRDGELDEQIEQRLGADVFAASAAKSKSGSGRTQRAGPDSEPEPTIPPSVARPLQSPAAPASSAPVATAAGAGELAVASERPLDELILDYLVEAARRRKRRAE